MATRDDEAGELHRRITTMHEVLAADPDGPLAGRIPPPCSALQRAKVQAREYVTLLQEADGGRYGVIDLFAASDLRARQYPSVDFPGGGDEWLIVGQLLYDPLALARDGELWLRPLDERLSRRLGSMSRFLLSMPSGGCGLRNPSRWGLSPSASIAVLARRPARRPR